MPLMRAKRITVIGYTAAALGVLLFTQLAKVEKLKMGSGFTNAVGLGALGAALIGFVTAIVGSVIWAQRAPDRQPVKVSASIAVACLLITFVVGVNVHGQSAILMFVVLLSLINVFSVLLASIR